jgi:hypothetical protein
MTEDPIEVRRSMTSKFVKGSIMKRSLSWLALVAAVGLSTADAQTRYAAQSAPPSGTISIEPSTTPTQPPPQDRAVAPAPGIATTPQNGDRKVEIDLRAPRIRCGDKIADERATCLREMQAEDQIRLPADTAPRPDAGGMARTY